jgi:hypothetical protein
MMTMLESKVLLEFTEMELKQILGTAVKQMVRLASEPSSDSEIETLGSVIQKCSKATQQIDSSSLSLKSRYVKAS